MAFFSLLDIFDWEIFEGVSTDESTMIFSFHCNSNSSFDFLVKDLCGMVILDSDLLGIKILEILSLYRAALTWL